MAQGAVKGVIFDVDGTLVDSVDLHARAWQRILQKWGHEVPFETVRSQIGKGGDELMPVFLSPAELEQDGRAIEKERGELFKAEYLDEVRPFPGVADLMQALLNRGVKVALGSSGKEEEVEHHKKLLGIDGMDLVQTTSEDAAKSKPHPDIFKAALDKLGLPAGEVVAVGDTPYDAEAAVKAGITPVGVLCGGFAAADLTKAGCVALFRDPADLLARLGEIVPSACLHR